VRICCVHFKFIMFIMVHHNYSWYFLVKPDSLCYLFMHTFWLYDYLCVKPSAGLIEWLHTYKFCEMCHHDVTQDALRFEKMSSLAVKHSCDSAARSLKLVHTSIDSLTADLKTLADAGYHNIEPLRNRCLVGFFCPVLYCRCQKIDPKGTVHFVPSHSLL